MGLLNLIEQHNRIWLPPDSLSQLAALIISHISRRRTDKTADRVTFLIFTHINSGHHILVIEKEFSQRLRKFCLSDTCSSHEQERPYRSFLILQSGAGTSDCIQNRFYRQILSDHTFVQLRLHAQQFLTFALKHSAYRDTRPLRNNLCNILRSNRFRDNRILDLFLTFCQLINLCLGFRHLGITDLCHLSIVSHPLGIMSLYLIVLHLLTSKLKFRQNLFLLLPLLAKLVSLMIQLLQFRLDLIHLEGYAFTFDCLPLDFKLTYTAVKFCNRFGNRVHLQPQL